MQRASYRRNLTPAQPDSPATSLRDFVSGAYSRSIPGRYRLHNKSVAFWVGRLGNAWSGSCICPTGGRPKRASCKQAEPERGQQSVEQHGTCDRKHRSGEQRRWHARFARQQPRQGQQHRSRGKRRQHGIWRRCEQQGHRDGGKRPDPRRQQEASVGWLRRSGCAPSTRITSPAENARSMDKWAVTVRASAPVPVHLVVSDLLRPESTSQVFTVEAV